MDHCAVDLCSRSATKRGFCETHYRKALYKGEFGRPKCSIEGCENFEYSKGICRAHYKRQRRYGNPLSGYRTRGSGNFTPDGYYRVSIDGRRQLHHRYLMEQHLGRKLLPTEHVHHKNENKLDNRLENLELVDIVAHQHIHRKKRFMSETEIECTRCHLILSKSIFAKDKHNWTGFQSKCLPCCAELKRRHA